MAFERLMRPTCSRNTTHLLFAGRVDIYVDIGGGVGHMSLTHPLAVRTIMVDIVSVQQAIPLGILLLRTLGGKEL